MDRDKGAGYTPRLAPSVQINIHSIVVIFWDNLKEPIMAKKKVDPLHAVTKNTHTRDVHYLDNSESAKETVDTPETAEEARLTGDRHGQRTRTSTARFSEEDLKNLLDPEIHGEVRVGVHD